MKKPVDVSTAASSRSGGTRAGTIYSFDSSLSASQILERNNMSRQNYSRPQQMNERT
jgi:hypothetical protein